jgi:hypothetical protein
MGRGRWLTDGSFSAVFLRNHARQSNDASVCRRKILCNRTALRVAIKESWRSTRRRKNRVA